MDGEFPDELWHMILAAMGKSPAAFAEQCRLARVCRAFRSGVHLPRDNNGVCSVNLRELVNYVTLSRRESLDVFNLTTMRVERIGCNSEQLVYTFPGKPCSSARLYKPGLLLVWCPPGCNVRFCYPIDTTTNNARSPYCIADSVGDGDIAKLVKIPLKDFALSKDDTRLCCAKENFKLKSRTKSSQASQSTSFEQQAIDYIARVMRLPQNSSVVGMHLDLDANAQQWFDVDSLINSMPRVTQLCLTAPRVASLAATHLSPSAIVTIAQNATHIELLDLSAAVDLSSLHSASTYIATCALGNLMQTWKRSGNKCVHRLVLDDIIIAHFVELIFGACMPDRCTMEAITRDSYTTDTCPVLYLSCSGMSFFPWRETIALAHAATTDLLDATIRLKLAQGEEHPLPTKKSKPASKPTDARFVAGIVVGQPTSTDSHYSNASRERDRYMWQWFDYECKNCRTVWPKHTVTISFRQTCVSECLKGKRSCASRQEYTSMKAGNLWITDKHIEGTGGLDLTPTPSEVLAAEAQGRLVGINAETKNREYFVPHAERPGLKVLA